MEFSLNVTVFYQQINIVIILMINYSATQDFSTYTTLATRNFIGLEIVDVRQYLPPK